MTLRYVLENLGNVFPKQEKKQLFHDISEALKKGILQQKAVEETINIAILSQKELSLGVTAINAILLYDLYKNSILEEKYIKNHYNKYVFDILDGLVRAYLLYEKNLSTQDENFRKFLISLASDARVIMIMLVERLYTMRNLENIEQKKQQKIAREASFLFAPLAHRMGLYAIKTEMEDLSLKYTSPEIYKKIAQKLKETKKVRDNYIEEFIKPINKRLLEQGLKFEIKGRTKSINSIYNKIRKQGVPFEKVYDLFAIRIIIDAPLEKEKADCWNAYSVVTDMYPPNTNRLRDWLSVPKLNGYESLHITVMGNGGRWVEVQIRTTRMDEIAEKGFAAHWKYKGVKSDSAKSDEWLANLRSVLENTDAANLDIVSEFKMQLYDDDVFVFTPKGELKRLGKGATLLDFAYSIHSKIGNQCVSGLVDNKQVNIKYVLKNGDQVVVQTSVNQKPKKDWLKIVATPRAKTKIRQALTEIEHKEAENGREILQRRLKNWKIPYVEGDIAKISKKLSYKHISEFFQDITNEKIDVLTIRNALLEEEKRDLAEFSAVRSVENYEHQTDFQKISAQQDVLEIDQNLKNIEYTLAKCCNPIFGDDIFGFVSLTDKRIKIHRKNCPNAPAMISKLGHRIVNARWADKGAGSYYPVTLHVIGRDDIGIVTNITSFISKEQGLNMRSISVDSSQGLFEGNITIMVSQISHLEQVIRKIKGIKGVKQVYRV
ncbi:MAG: HD domain-containing protein [Prevotellaceae bacterium]|jgi:GTP pyrophosphokinase|nr:HD domain-containing protein [Prevotellaceae bacterium]